MKPILALFALTFIWTAVWAGPIARVRGVFLTPDQDVRPTVTAAMLDGGSSTDEGATIDLVQFAFASGQAVPDDASFVTAHDFEPGEYTVRLKVTDSNGNSAISENGRVIVTWRTVFDITFPSKSGVNEISGTTARYGSCERPFADNDISADSSRYIFLWSNAQRYIQYRFVDGTRPRVNGYMLAQCYGDAATRGPKAWTFEGSDDGEVWTVLDRVSNEPKWANNEARRYGAWSEKGYEYYRFVFTANWGAADMQLSRVEFYSVDSFVPDPPEPATMVVRNRLISEDYGVNAHVAADSLDGGSTPSQDAKIALREFAFDKGDAVPSDAEFVTEATLSPGVYAFKLKVTDSMDYSTISDCGRIVVTWGDVIDITEPYGYGKNEVAASRIGIGSAATPFSCGPQEQGTARCMMYMSEPCKYLQYHFTDGTAHRVNGYQMSQCYVSSASRGPRAWTFEGSNDGETWTVLDRVVDEPQWKDNEIRRYGAYSDRAYSWFRIVFTQNWGASDYVQLSTLELYEVLVDDNPKPTPVAQNVFVLLAEEEEKADILAALLDKASLPGNGASITGRALSVDGEGFVASERLWMGSYLARLKVTNNYGNEAISENVGVVTAHESDLVGLTRPAKSGKSEITSSKAIVAASGAFDRNAGDPRVLLAFYGEPGFDGDEVFIQYKFTDGTAPIVNAYRFDLNYQGGFVGSRAPRDWVLKASNDGTNWDVIDRRSGEAGWGNPSGMRTYATSATRGYTTYRFVFTQINTPVDASERRLQIGSVEFYRVKAKTGLMIFVR